MSTHVQWNLPQDTVHVSYTEPAIGGDDVVGVRMSNGEGASAWLGEQLVIYGEVAALRDWHDRVGAVLDAIPDPEPRFVFDDIPPHPGHGWYSDGDYLADITDPLPAGHQKETEVP